MSKNQELPTHNRNTLQSFSWIPSEVKMKTSGIVCRFLHTRSQKVNKIEISTVPRTVKDFRPTVLWHPIWKYPLYHCPPWGRGGGNPIFYPYFQYFFLPASISPIDRHFLGNWRKVRRYQLLAAISSAQMSISCFVVPNTVSCTASLNYYYFLFRPELFGQPLIYLCYDRKFC